MSPTDTAGPHTISAKFWQHLSFRVFVTVLLSWALLMLGSFAGSYRTLEKAFHGNVRTTIEQTSQILNTAISASSFQQSGDLRTLETFLQEVVHGEGQSGIVYVMVVSDNGNAVLQAGMTLGKLPAQDEAEDFEGCAARGMCHIRSPILLQGNHVGYLQYGLATQSTIDALSRANINLLALTTLASLMVFGTIAYAGLGIARRAANLSRASKEIAAGNYDIRVKVDGSDELSDLSVNFNRMADAVQANIAEISALKDGLEARVEERTHALHESNRALEAHVAKLNTAREQLVRSEKLAGLGAMVAGVSHELNTPIGNALVAATTVQQRTAEFAKQVAQDQITRRSLEVFIQTSMEGNALTERALIRAAELIASFKSVAVDQTSERRREFDLALTVNDVLQTMYYARKISQHRIEIDVPTHIVLDSFPGPLMQVVSNLIDNALVHAFDAESAGCMQLNARCDQSGYVRIEFRDNGRGIPQEHLSRVFDPFFTTRLGQGGSGLGLNIVINIVEGLLGGTIRVESELGVGTVFVIDLPLVAPMRQ